MLCPHCAKENLESARFCNACGKAMTVASTPPPATPARGRPWALMGCLAAVLVLVALVAAGLVGVWFFARWQDRPSARPAMGILPPAQVSSERAACDARADQLVQALRSGDAQAAGAAVYPEMRKAMQGLVQSDPAAAQRLAALLAARKPAAFGRRLIEYEVTDGGQARHVAFQKVGDEWLLVSF